MVVAAPMAERDSVTPLLRVQLLGPFAIHMGGKSAGPWPRRSAKRLLALVCLSPKRRVPREVASDVLFPDLAPRAAANALYSALSSARAVLADLGGPATALLTADHGHIYISPNAPVEVALDLDETSLRAALGMGPGADRDTGLTLALAEDGTLLEDEPYADWSLRRRDDLELVRQDARVALARDRLMGYGRSDANAVIEAWEAVFSHDLASEEAAEALMATYACQGQRQLAVRTYSRCVAGLEELGLEPSAALERAYHGAKHEVANLAPPPAAPRLSFTGNLPTRLSSFVGRQTEQAEVCSLVRSSCLVTVVGPGGSGKTRLALEVAAHLVDEGRLEASFVDLAPVAQAAQVAAVFANALGVREPGSGSIVEVLAEALSGPDLLVVLDNCEHVIVAAAELAELLNRRCPRLRLLATAREPLSIESEHVYRLGPMSLPPAGAGSVQDLAGSDAVQLFVERARAHDSTFVLEAPTAGRVASICRRLDGAPLAIELAAARLASMSLAHLDDRLDQRFRLLTGGPRTALPRQRTLQATVDWSFELLAPPERAVLNRLSVFPGAFELEAAEAVCSDEALPAADIADALGSLVNKSLVMAQRSSGSVRYSLLETIRQYGSERLRAAGGQDALHRTRAAHAQFYLQFAESAGLELHGPDQGLWLRRLDLDWDNLRAALAFFLAGQEGAEAVLRIGNALQYFFWTRCQRYGIDAVLSVLSGPAPVPAAVRAKALCFCGTMVGSTLGWDSEAERRAAGALADQGLELARALGDQGLTGYTLSDSAWLAESLGEHAKALQRAEEGLEIARNLGDKWLIGNSLAALGTVAAAPAEKRALWQEAVEQLKRVGDLAVCSVCMASRAVLELEEEQSAVAGALLEEAIALSEEIGAPLHLYWCWGLLGEARVLEGGFEEAAVCSQKALAGFRRLGLRDLAVSHLINIACCATRLGRHKEAAQLTGSYDVMHSPYLRHAGTPGRSNVFEKLTLLQEKLREDSRDYLRQALGKEAFQLGYATGTRLTFDGAVELALRVTR